MKTHTYDQVLKASEQFFSGDVFATDAFGMKYALRNSQDEYLELTPADMLKRVAAEFTRAEARYENAMSEQEILDLLVKTDDSGEIVGFGDVVPQGSPLAAIGNTFQCQSLSNCFVIAAPYDSYAGIMYADEQLVQIMKRRGGVGVDVSPIRPKDMPTTNAARTTDGIGIFIQRYSNTCGEVAQNGRRGALMLTISCMHPEIETFINIKRNKLVANDCNMSIKWTDEFMKAVKEGTDVTLRWPVDATPENARATKVVNAAAIFDQFVRANWEAAEPGGLFWDTVLRMSPADCYKDLGFQTLATNPCVVGDTLIAVADGRNAVTIKQLVEEAKDVPVYACSRETGKTVIRMMRNPRLTGRNAPVYRVTIEGGHTFTTTGNHKMILCDNASKRVDELTLGDQLWISHKVMAKFSEALPGMKATQSQNYWWIRNHGSRSWRTEHRDVWKFYNHRPDHNYVIHHRDFNALNNQIGNLAIMKKSDHDAYHASKMMGKNNPIFKIKSDPNRFAKYLAKMSKSTSGLNNPRAYDVSNDEFKRHLTNLTQQFKRRVTRSDWVQYATEHQLIVWPNSWRCEGKNFFSFASEIADSLGFKHPNADGRLLRNLNEAIKQGYIADIIDDKVIVNRVCEWCHCDFTNHWDHREIAFCSLSCALIHGNRRANKNVKRSMSLQEMHFQKAKLSKKNILDVFTELRLKLGRDPKQDELRSLCKERGYSYRTNTKNGFKDWNDIKQHAVGHNHRIISIEQIGTEDVYTGTVDEDHTFCIVAGEEKLDGFENSALLLIASEQCGELPLPAYDSCRLMIVNAKNFVVDPWTDHATFDYDRFALVVQKAQRLMDDLVDLEIEAVRKIIAKVNSDPEPDFIKQRELLLWERILSAAALGRRTGLGLTAVGDTLASLGERYGSDESIEVVDHIYRCLAINSYKSSVKMAKERGSFPIYERIRESGHPFIEKIMAEDAEMRDMYDLYGRRNIANLTTAPVGSISCMLQVTSGIEPAYQIDYTRRRKLMPNDTCSVDFTDKKGVKWHEYAMTHHGFEEWMATTGHTREDFDASPYARACANDIDWLASVNLQATAQKWIDHSISKTVNLPKEATVELVKEVYLDAWSSGCKGITIYRDGSRDGILVSNDVNDLERPDVIVDSHAPKRPAELKCDIHRVNVKGEQYLVFVGLLNGRPYEVFAGLSQYVEVPRKAKTGILVKNGRKEGVATYNLKIPYGDDDEIMFRDVVNLFDNAAYGALTRTISLALRHGVPIQYLIEQLRKDKHSDFTSFSNVIARVLSKTYVRDGTKATFEKTCDICGSNQLSYQQGCVFCVACGASKCS